jgi:TRAP-type mannitol/chloroaromatic compound transport system permease small subunit
MDQEPYSKFDVLEQKIDLIYASVEKTRKYIFWTMIVSLVFFVLPLILLAVAVPVALTSYTGMLEGL